MGEFFRWLTSPLTVAWLVFVTILLSIVSWCQLADRSTPTPPKTQTFALEIPRLPEKEPGVPGPLEKSGQQLEAGGLGFPQSPESRSAQMGMTIEEMPPLSQQEGQNPRVAGAAEGAVPADNPPFRKYSKKILPLDPKPQIAIIVTGLGLDPSVTQQALQLPAPVTLAFSVYGNQLQEAISAASQAGHESLLVIPMESDGYPQDDPGPLALFAGDTPQARISRFAQLVQSVEGVVGISHTMGNKLASEKSLVLPLLQFIKGQGFLWVDFIVLIRSLIPDIAKQLGVPRVQGTITIDEEASHAGIQSALERLEAIALKEGDAVGIASPYPVSLESITIWAKTLDKKGVVLVPITAIYEKKSL